MIRTPVRLSLLRKISWMGGDRRLVGMSGLLMIVLGWTLFIAYGFNFGLPIWLPMLIYGGILWAAREAYMADPYMIDVVQRHFSYRKHYGPHPSPDSEHPAIRDFN